MPESPGEWGRGMVWRRGCRQGMLGGEAAWEGLAGACSSDPDSDGSVFWGRGVGRSPVLSWWGGDRDTWSAVRMEGVGDGVKVAPGILGGDGGIGDASEPGLG